MGFTIDKLIWTDRKRYFGLPLSFTKYAISEDRLFQSTGLLNLKYEEILLYRIRDITLSRSFGQRIFGVGSITVSSSDQSRPILTIQNVKMPVAVKELLHEQVEEMKIRRRIRYGEVASFNHDIDDSLDDVGG
jgi:uncharacterized membrane protein YdbT with pleckstrin-like domain